MKENRKGLISITAVLVALLMLSACGSASGSAQSSAAASGAASSTSTATAQESAVSAAPAVLGTFATTDLDGNSVDQSIFEGTGITMVNIWATFCGPCIQEMPELGELSQEYEEKGLKIVGLVVDVVNQDGTLSTEQIALAKEIVEKTGAGYLHIMPSAEMNGLLASVTGVPTTLFVDETGAQVGEAYVGARSAAQWRKVIDAVLAEAAL